MNWIIYDWKFNNYMVTLLRGERVGATGRVCGEAFVRGWLKAATHLKRHIDLGDPPTTHRTHTPKHPPTAQLKTPKQSNTNRQLLRVLTAPIGGHLFANFRWIFRSECMNISNFQKYKFRFENTAINIRREKHWIRVLLITTWRP